MRGRPLRLVVRRQQRRRLTAPAACARAPQGYEGFLASKENMRKRARNYKADEKGDERAWSLSSRTSGAAPPRNTAT